MNITLLGYTADKGGVSGLGTKQVIAGFAGYVTSVDIVNLDQPIHWLKIRVSAPIAPTSGSISTWVLGRYI